MVLYVESLFDQLTRYISANGNDPLTYGNLTL